MVLVILDINKMTLKYSVPLRTYIDPVTKAELYKIAGKKQMSVSKLVAKVLREYVDNKENSRSK